MKKTDAEKIFVDHLLKVGVSKYGSAYDNGHEYWFFDLSNDERRYWKNLSIESQKQLGVYSE